MNRVDLPLHCPMLQRIPVVTRPSGSRLYASKVEGEFDGATRDKIVYVHNTRNGEGCKSRNKNACEETEGRKCLVESRSTGSSFAQIE